MSALRVVLGVAAAAAVVIATAAASHTTITLNRNDASMLRVALSARPERVENCRTVSDEELAALPQHMRQRVICDGVTARYNFEVLRDDVLLASSEVTGGGLRHDRQLYLFRELSLPAGRAVLEVRLTRIDSGAPASSNGSDSSVAHVSDDDSRQSLASDGRDQREVDEHRRRVEDEVPASLVFRETVTLQPREVVLVTYDRDQKRLLLVRDSALQAHALPEVSDAGHRTYPR